jgi:hypothetical protein
MVHISLRDWQVVSVTVSLAAIAAAALWLLTRKRPTADQLERERRLGLLSYGRIVDGMLLDGFQVAAPDASMRDMLLYSYEISGVHYECSQDITSLAEIVKPEDVKVGMPCSIRYQPGSPENSILICERWSGLRESVPVVFPPPEEHGQHTLDFRDTDWGTRPSRDEWIAAISRPAAASEEEPVPGPVSTASFDSFPGPVSGTIH